MADDTKTNDAAQTGAEPGNNTAAATGQAPASAQPAGDDRKFTQAELEEKIKLRLAEEKDRERKRREEQERKIREEEAVKQGEFKTVAEERASRIKELEPQIATLTERATALEAVVSADITAREAKLPEKMRPLLKTLVPDGDVLKQFQALGQLEAAAAELAVAQVPGTPPGPTNNGTPPPPAPDPNAKKQSDHTYRSLW